MNLPPLYQLYLQEAASRGCLLVISAKADNDLFTCSGHITPPFGIPLRTKISVNGSPAAVTRYVRSESLSERYGFGDVFEFDASVPVDVVRSAGGQALIQMHPGGSREPLTDLSYFYQVGGVTLPDAERRNRVHGSTDEASYILVGASTAWKIRRVLDTHFGEKINTVGNVLDWGCGCGRVLQYLSTEPLATIYGCDIDADNLNWCQQNIGFGKYEVTGIEPPLPYDSNFFNLIYGISIFTHLSSEDEVKWLEELRRVVVPGGIVLMSVHGAMTQFYHKSPDVIAAVQAGGWCDVGQNKALDASVPDPQRYRDIFHTPRRVFDVWSKHFDILDILQGYVGSNQDMIVMTKPVSG